MPYLLVLAYQQVNLNHNDQFFVCTRYYVWHLPTTVHNNMDRLSTISIQNLICSAIFGQIEPPRSVECLPHYGSIGVKCLCQGHNHAQPSSGTKLRVDNFAVANLRSYSLSCITTNWDESVKRLFQGQLHSMPGVGIELANLVINI